jgi:hypothetical protein
MRILFQVPPVPAYDQPEGHPEDIPGPGRVQDPHHFDVAYHPQPLVGVSNSHVAPPFINDISGNRTLHMYSPM